MSGSYQRESMMNLFKWIAIGSVLVIGTLIFGLVYLDLDPDKWGTIISEIIAPVVGMFVFVLALVQLKISTDQWQFSKVFELELQILDSLKQTRSDLASFNYVETEFDEGEYITQNEELRKKCLKEIDKVIGRVAEIEFSDVHELKKIVKSLKPTENKAYELLLSHSDRLKKIEELKVTKEGLKAVKKKRKEMEMNKPGVQN